MQMFYKIVSGKSPVPLLPFDREGKSRVADGVELFLLPDAARVSGKAEQYLLDLWTATWSDYIQDDPGPPLPDICQELLGLVRTMQQLEDDVLAASRRYNIHSNARDCIGQVQNEFYSVLMRHLTDGREPREFTPVALIKHLNREREVMRRRIDQLEITDKDERHELFCALSDFYEAVSYIAEVIPDEPPPQSAEEVAATSTST